MILSWAGSKRLRPETVPTSCKTYLSVAFLMGFLSARFFYRPVRLPRPLFQRPIRYTRAMNEFRTGRIVNQCGSILAIIIGTFITGCSEDRVRAKLEPTERAVQPTVSAFECGGGSLRTAIASCRAEGGHYGHCALVASRAGVSGATACYTYANEIRKRRAELVGKEDQLDAQIGYLRSVNADTEILNTELSSRVDDATARADTAVESLAQGEMTKSELEQLRSILDVEVSSAQQQLEVASRELRAANQYRSQQQSPTAALDDEIARLPALLDETQRHTKALVSQRQRL